MKTKALSELERNLAGYLAHVDYWDEDQGDSFLMLNCRELLAENENALTADQKKQMKLADNKILALAAKNYADETSDVGFLKLTADVINGNNFHQ